MATTDGGPAFPAKNYIVPPDLEERHVRALGATQGMTLRDYFAAKASDKDVKSAMFIGESWTDSADRCRARFRHADAMLAERAK